VKLYINGRYLTQEITGVQRYAHEIVRGLDESLDLHAGLEVTLLAPARTLRFTPTLRRVRLKQVGTSPGYLWEQLDLPRYVRDGVLFCPGNSAPVWSLLGGCATVVTVHDLSYRYFPAAYDWRFRALYGLLMPLVMRFAREIITVSDSERAAITQHFPQSAARLTAIQNGGFGGDVLQRVSAIPARALAFRYGLYVGSFSRRKNFPALLEAAVQLARETPLGFVFVGGAHPVLARTTPVVPEDVREKIHFTGQVSEALELVGWYKGAVFTAFPSLYEASPLPPIEAMSCGSPVLASAIPSLEERCGEAALYCDPRDPRDLYAKMHRLAVDSALRTDLTARGARRAAEFSWAACTRATLEVLRHAGLGESLNPSQTTSRERP
jgi:glycosyltransferase involved in cell wall biosynthesis